MGPGAYTAFNVLRLIAFFGVNWLIVRWAVKSALKARDKDNAAAQTLPDAMQRSDPTEKSSP